MKNMKPKLFEGLIVNPDIAHNVVSCYYQSLIHAAEKSIDGSGSEEDLKMVENRIKKLQEDRRECINLIQQGEPFQLEISINA
jgi:hypothetical protein